VSQEGKIEKMSWKKSGHKWDVRVLSGEYPDLNLGCGGGETEKRNVGRAEGINQTRTQERKRCVKPEGGTPEKKKTVPAAFKSGREYWSEVRKNGTMEGGTCGPDNGD